MYLSKVLFFIALLRFVTFLKITLRETIANLNMSQRLILLTLHWDYFRILELLHELDLLIVWLIVKFTFIHIYIQLVDNFSKKAQK